MPQTQNLLLILVLMLSTSSAMSNTTQKDIRGSLRGAMLRVSFSGPFPHIINEKDGVKGASIEVLDILAKKFEFEYQLRPERGFDPIQTEENSTVGLIPALMNGEADLGIGQMSMTYERNQLVDFLAPMSSYQLVFAYLKPKPVDSLYTILRPFDTYIWQLLLLSMVLVFSVLALHDSLFKLGRITSSFEVPALSFALPLQESVPFEWIFRYSTTKLPIRLWLIMLWLMVSLVLSLAYKSVVLAMLTTVEYEKPVDSVQDILDRQLTLTVNSATTMHSALATSTRPIIQQLYNEAVVGRDGLFINEPGNRMPKRIVEARRSGKAALATTRRNAEAPDIYHIARDDEIMKTHTSWAVPNRSGLANVLNPSLTALREGGILAKLENDHVQRTARRNRLKRLKEAASSGDGQVANKDQPLTFRQCQPMFLLHILGISLAVVFFLAEKLQKKREAKQQRKSRVIEVRCKRRQSGP